MLFSSLTFLYYFLPVTMILYFLAPVSMRNMILLISSLVFYGWGEPKYVILMIVSIMAGYVSGLLIETFLHFRDGKYKKAALFTGVALQVGNLMYFKYADFFIENVNRFAKTDIPLLKVVLPIGISFYTFQILSYIIDVYRKEVKAQKNPLLLAVYVSMFPQLIAGPIVRYSDIERQLRSRTSDLSSFALGSRRFVMGLSKKVLLANPLGELCEIFKASGDKSVLFFWVYACSFTLHIFYDFSGYSDMAIGLGKIFGFDFPENFDYPYISKSITEFWRRWHKSLGSWFRDYVFIPLGGSRGSQGRVIFNMLVVWMLTGFWHGAQWNYIFWGLYYVAFLILEKRWLHPYLKKGKIWPHCYFLLVSLISFVIFNGANMMESLSYLQGMFGLGGYPMVSESCFYYMKSYLLLFVIGTAVALPVTAKGYGKVTKKFPVLEPIVLIACILLSTAFLVDGSFNPFLYFRF